jgi:cell division septum initiation protein DivIVA
MSSRIEQLIDELEEYIESCKPKLWSSSEIIVNKDDIDDLLRELRMKTPDEIKRYQKIISNKEAILNDARAKAQALIDEATVHTTELLSEHEIMQQAHAQANGIVTTAARQAQEILDKATIEANNLKMQASKYTEDRLAELNVIVQSAIQTTAANYEKTMGALIQYRDLIQSNIRALRPVEDLEELPLDEHEDDKDIDEM